MEKILIVGTGGRENALGWKFSKNEMVSKVLYLPENTDFNYVRDFIFKKKINLTVIGSEAPLSRGIVDFLGSRGIHNVFGPTQDMTKIESDKFYSYDFMQEMGVPQARSIKCFSNYEIINAIKKFEQPVLKYRWLAKGKGVRVYSSQEEAKKDLESFVDDFGQNVLVAERLFGREASIFGIADGKNILPFEMAFQDYKRAYDEDEGPNTGGMGAYGPSPAVSKETIQQILDSMIPIVRKIKYRGIIYPGIIITSEGPKVIEINARFGDPETQPMVMLGDDLYSPIVLSLEGKVIEAPIKFKEGASCCVVLASKGYPGNYETGFPISGIEDAEKVEGVNVFHAGTKFENSFWVTNGGRVLDVTSYSERGLEGARELAYRAGSKINIPGGFHYRRDIAEINK